MVGNGVGIALVAGSREHERASGVALLLEPVEDLCVVGQDRDIDIGVFGEAGFERGFAAARKPHERPVKPQRRGFEIRESRFDQHIRSNQRAIQVNNEWSAAHTVGRLAMGL
ncbi:hypothetical protein NECAME_16086 [Necator americanus]|uniref:Uncharacterized protein n=1 Tax=Necator americanus TaxID=51031 RepID=W2TYD5_NECAM|nr:hypothetical protein NECAME_16086 [Necator americanus]ETN86853.1 hypothetical protein NECAME_16086 [Necator americanus]